MKLLFSLLFTLGFLNAFAQRQNVYFLKNNGSKVKVRDSADYIRIIREPDSGSTFYKMLEYYLNGNPRRAGETSAIEPIRLEGPCTGYFEDGSRKNVLNYRKGVLTGEQSYYYPNGKISEIRNYPDSLNKNQPAYKQVYLLTTFNDIDGTPLVTNGNGHQKTYDSKFTKVTAEGDILNGFKNGEWKTSVKNDSLKLNEIYNNGKFVSGTATNANGESYTYNQAEALPEFKGGMPAFYRFLAQTLRYPALAQEQNIQGYVYVSFIIETDGSITHIKNSGVSPGAVLSAEAIRVIGLSPKWNPGIQYGRPVRTSYTVPVVFTLSRNR